MFAKVISHLKYVHKGISDKKSLEEKKKIRFLIIQLVTGATILYDLIDIVSGNGTEQILENAYKIA